MALYKLLVGSDVRLRDAEVGIALFMNTEGGGYARTDGWAPDVCLSFCTDESDGASILSCIAICNWEEPLDLTMALLGFLRGLDDARFDNVLPWVQERFEIYSDAKMVSLMDERLRPEI